MVLIEAGLVVILVPGETKMVVDNPIGLSAKFVVVLVMYLSNATIVLISISKALQFNLQARILSSPTLTCQLILQP